MCAAPLGENSWKLALGVPQILPHTPFSFACFALYPSIVMSLSCENSFMPSPLSTFRESVNLEMVLRLILDIDIKMFVVIWAIGVCVYM